MLRTIIHTMLLAVVLQVLPPVSTAGSIDHSQLVEDAHAGNLEAQYTLAHLLLKGRGGLRPDASSAVDWFARAAGGGHQDAAFDLALLYLEGERLEKDNEQALIWLRAAADLGHNEAQYYLGLVYRESDVETAVLWLEKARDGGHETAGKELVLLCQEEEVACP